MKDGDTKMNDFRSERETLFLDLKEMIQTRSERLTGLGFIPEMALFDCLITMKMIVDEFYDEFNVGHARQQWYREYIRSLKYVLVPSYQVQKGDFMLY